MGSEEGELSIKIDSSDASVLLVDEFEKAETAVWNFFLDLLEAGTCTDSQEAEHNLQGFTIVFTTNCPRDKLSSTFPAELLSRFSLMANFSHLSTEDKKPFIERYVSRIYERSLSLPPKNVPRLPKDFVDRALSEHQNNRQHPNSEKTSRDPGLATLRKRRGKTPGSRRFPCTGIALAVFNSLAGERCSRASSRRAGMSSRLTRQRHFETTRKTGTSGELWLDGEISVYRLATSTSKTFPSPR
ncbi:MAG: AAA family ATPase [Olsenella sp.]|nr:AAA family ATPase [Olsenella sp.]